MDIKELKAQFLTDYLDSDSGQLDMAELLIDAPLAKIADIVETVRQMAALSFDTELFSLSIRGKL